MWISIDSTHAQSKNVPQDRNAAGGSLGSWGVTRGSFLHGERGDGSSRIWPWSARLQWCHYDESILSQEWTRVYTMIRAGAWARHQCVILTWERALPQSLGLGQYDLASPPRRAWPPRCWLLEQRQEKWGCDLNVPCGQTVRAEALTSAMKPCFPLGLDGWSAGSGPHSGPAGCVCGWTPALHAHMLNNPLLFTCHTVIWFTIC